jgi:predicted nucleotidyltransferase
MNGELKALFKKHSSRGFDLESSCIILGYRGSIAHGTYVPQEDPNSIDDKDIMAVNIPPVPYYLGLQQYEGTEFFEGVWDTVIYELRKYVRLLLKCNPNVLSLMWLEPQDYIYIHPVGKKLIDSRKLFVSKQAFHSFVGYANGQLHRMTHQAYSGYMGAKRKGLVDKFGYDTKNAAHLVRLLRMGIEFLTEGELYVKRKDSAELLEIKRGEWSLEKVKKVADDLFKLAHEAYVRSPLPNKPEEETIHKLLIDLIAEYHGISWKLESATL